MLLPKPYPGWNPKRPTVPVDENGNWMSYPAYNIAGWEEILEPFEAVMRVSGMRAGWSAKNIVLEDERGRTYPMFIKDVVDLLQTATIVNGDISARWTVAKRGSNYGIKAVKE